MNDNKSTSNPPEIQVPIVNDALNLRWRYFRSIGGTMALACFDSAPLEDSPFFLEIDRIEYDHLCKEFQS